MNRVLAFLRSISCPCLAAAIATVLLHSPEAAVAASTGRPAAEQHRSRLTANGYQRKWWKEAVVYQIYPRSFQDSNGDGIGDLNGITSRLDYLQHLGVNVIWLSPHYDSPNVDNGYDIRDYRKVMAEFGTMGDFDTMLRGIKNHHMKLIVDLVVNHTSDEHRWFVESRRSKINPFRDYYIWRPGTNDGPPNNDTSFFSESAWTKDQATGEYYLHYFAQKQPDLNWDNPKVRAEVYDLMRFWLDKGVDGFRMDVIPLISKDQNFPNLTPAQLKEPENVYSAGPRLHEYLKEMNTKVVSHYDVMTVGEAFGITLQQEPLMIDERRRELNMVFNFGLAGVDGGEGVWHPWALPALKSIFTEQDQALDAHSWNTIYLSNHDSTRVVSRFGDDSPPFRVPSAKVLATLLLTLRGTPFLFEGDELGMTNFPFTAMKQFDDIEAKNGYKAKVLTGQMSEEDFMANLRHTSRDNSRTPMQWSQAPNAGFTTESARPWLAVNPNYHQINAERELADHSSVYWYFAQMIALHKATPALIYGDYKDLDPTNSTVFAYTRILGKVKYLIVLNFSETPARYTLPANVRTRSLVIRNQPGPREEHATWLDLKGWDARIYRF